MMMTVIVIVLTETGLMAKVTPTCNWLVDERLQ